MKSKVFLAKNAKAEVVLEYQEKIMILPDSNQTLPIIVKNLGNQSLSLNVNCESKPFIKCPNGFSVSEKEIKSLPIQTRTEDAGIYSINFKIKGKKEGIILRASNPPKTLLNIPSCYNKNLSRFKEEVYRWKIPRFVLNEAYESYEKSLLHHTSEKLGNIKKEKMRSWIKEEETCQFSALIDFVVFTVVLKSIPYLKGEDQKKI